MAYKKSGLVTYKREKGKVEIIGEARDTKGLIWVDIISSQLWLLLTIVLLITLPKATFVPILWRVIRSKLVVSTIFLGAASLLFSG